MQTTIKGLFRKVPKSKLRNNIMELLAKEGFRPEAIDNAIVFKMEGTSLYFAMDKDDPQFVRFELPHFYEVSADDTVLALYNMNYINQRYKFVYLYMEDNIVSAAVDMLLYPELVGDAVLRMVDVLRDVAGEFRTEMAKGYEL